MYLNITKNKDTSRDNLCTGLTMAVRGPAAIAYRSDLVSPSVYSGVFSGRICGKSSTSWMLG
jgi:hypothetical protein